MLSRITTNEQSKQNVHPLSPRVEKDVTGTKRGKRVLKLSSAGKHLTSAEHWEMRSKCLVCHGLKNVLVPMSRTEDVPKWVCSPVLQGCMNITAFGDARCQYVETISGGSGAVSCLSSVLLTEFLDGCNRAA